MAAKEKANETPPVSEEQKVLWNRYDRFKHLLPDADEECLQELTRAVFEVSPHDIEKLVNQGCPPATAAKIVKPL